MRGERCCVKMLDRRPTSITFTHQYRYVPIYLLFKHPSLCLGASTTGSCCHCNLRPLFYYWRMRELVNFDDYPRDRVWQEECSRRQYCEQETWIWQYHSLHRCFMRGGLLDGDLSPSNDSGFNSCSISSWQHFRILSLAFGYSGQQFASFIMCLDLSGELWALFW